MTGNGLIGVIAQETSRFSMFAASLTGLERPEGSSVKWIFGHDIADNANLLVRQMYENDHEWLWILGDDHAFSPTILKRLLAHDVEIIVPLCLMRNIPFQPVIYSHVDAEGRRVRVDLNDYPGGGRIAVQSAGSGGMLIKREVFDALSDPWFEAGVDSSVQLGEDIYFCDKASEEGFIVYCDLDTPMGHCSTSVVWPVNEPDGWTYGFSMMGGFQITMPPSVGWEVAQRVLRGEQP